MKTKYDASDIQVLTTDEAIRKRPGMYLAYKKNAAGEIVNDERDPSKFTWGGGVKDSHSFTRLITEVMCLSRALAAGGTVTEINVKVTNGTEVLISDNGPGVSMEKTRTNKALIDSLLTELFACKNLKHENVKAFCESGIVVANALSGVFSVLNTVDGTSYFISYTKGKRNEEPRIVGPAKNNGLAFKFIFDPEIFGDLKIDKEDLTAEIEKIKLTTPAKITLEFDN